MQCNISHDLHTFFENKGDTWQEHKGFFEDILAEMRKQEGGLNPGETKDTTDVRTTLQSQQGMLDVQEGAEGTGNCDG